MISAIILCAGESRRMKGRNKLLLPLEGRPLVRHVLESVSASSAAEIIAVIGYEVERVVPALSGFCDNITLNRHYADGQAGSICKGVEAAHRNATAFMICLGDLPLICTEEYDRAMALFRTRHATDPKAILRPTWQGRPGHPVVLSAAWRADILSEAAPRGCRNVVRRHPEHVTEVEWDSDHVVRDVDTPEAYGGLLPTRPA